MLLLRIKNVLYRETRDPLGDPSFLGLTCYSGVPGDAARNDR